MKPLVINHLSKSFGALQAVTDVSFFLEPGEIFGLLGPNGAGKTTIISCITSLVKPTQGSITIFDKPIGRDTKMDVGFVPQELISHGYFTIEEIMQIHASYYGLWKMGPRIKYLLDKLDLYGHRTKFVKQLSGGMKRRLLIAKALIHSPKLLLLDEPTAGVDIELRAQLWDFVRDMQKEGVTILLTTHYLEEAEKLCDRVGILNHGSLRTIGHTEGLIKEHTHREIILTLAQDIGKIKHPYLRLQDDHTLIFLVPKTFELHTLLTDLKLTLDAIQDLRIREGNLEDAFQHILEAHRNA